MYGWEQEYSVNGIMEFLPENSKEITAMGVMDKFLNYMKLTEDDDDDYYDEEPEEKPRKMVAVKEPVREEPEEKPKKSSSKVHRCARVQER